MIESYKRRRHPRSDASLSKTFEATPRFLKSLSFVTQRQADTFWLSSHHDGQRTDPLPTHSQKDHSQEKKEVFSPNGSLTFFLDLILLKTPSLSFSTLKVAIPNLPGPEENVYGLGNNCFLRKLPETDYYLLQKRECTLRINEGEMKQLIDIRQTVDSAIKDFLLDKEAKFTQHRGD